VVVQPLQIAVPNATDATPAAPHQQRIAREGPAAAMGLEDLSINDGNAWPSPKMINKMVDLRHIYLNDLMFPIYV